MAHTIYMGEDGIVRTAIIGDMTEEDARAFVRDAQPFLAASLAENPTHVLHDSSRSGKYTSQARKVILSVFSDPRIGKVAGFGPRPYSRVLFTFFIKASGRTNVRLFATKAEALTWLNSRE
ncbi:MAG: STAS/SEC14 domain-containing protein [Anaerolineae bacterium]|nr:STAS/SEC14 domain-containing protein [Anaerolineae bacterium]